MPPRRSARNSTSTTGKSPTLALSASRRAWDIVEIRHAILQCLPQDSLAKMMRVRKESFGDVARVLYHTVRYETLTTHLDGDTPRQRDYRAAVSVIEAYSYTIPRQIIDQYPILANPDITPEFLSKYDTAVIALILPFWKKHCPSIREIRFGPPKHHKGLQKDRWVVHFRPEYHVELFQTLTYSLAQPPPSTIDPPISPAHNCDLIHRFNLRLAIPKPRCRSQAALDQWRLAIPSAPHFANLYQILMLADVAVTLDDLAAVYQRQIDAGHEDRLSEITAPKAASWSIPDLRSFAQIASGSLTILKLANMHDPSLVQSSFADLPDLIQIVRTHLPNLGTLHIALNGIEGAEDECLKMLAGQDEMPGGSVRHLFIFTAATRTTGLFNVMRACIPMIDWASASSTGPVRMIPNGGLIPSWDHAAQIQYMAFIQGHQIERRKHLQTVDFASLDVTVPSDIYFLNFHPDGRPKSLWDSKIARFATNAQIAIDSLATLGPNLETALRNYRTQAIRMEEVKAAGGSAQDMYDEVTRLELALEDLRRAKAMLCELGEADSGDIESYAQSLARRQDVVV